MDLDGLIEQLLPDVVDKHVLQPYDVARQTFRQTAISVSSASAFAETLIAFVQHVDVTVGQGVRSRDAAFGTAKRILDSAFGDRFQEGYVASLGMAFRGTGGGLRAILNELTDGLKRYALNEYSDRIYYESVNVLSRDENRVLSRAYYQRFGSILQRFGLKADEETWAWNTRAALEYHRQVIEQILGIARKL